MASRETQQQSKGGSSSSFRGIRRLLHLKKNPESQHPLILPSAASSSAGPNKKKTGGGFAFRGLGCASSSSASQALMPADAAAANAAVRSSADWQGKRRARKRRGKRKGGRGHHLASPPSADIADVSDVWCAPGVVFGADASVDCVVAHRRVRVHRERAFVARRGVDEEIMSSFFDCPSMEMRHFGSGPMHSGHLHHLRGGHRRSPAEFEELNKQPKRPKRSHFGDLDFFLMMMFQTRMFLGGADIDDRYEDLRLDVDNMSYEELLELSERIGYVSSGLREEEILRNLRKPKHSIFGASQSQKEWKCIICQEEYEVSDDMGKLECGHSYHTHCIKQWLLRKNACPVCKTAMAAS